MNNKKNNRKQLVFRIVALVLAAMMILGGATYVISALVSLI